LVERLDSVLAGICSNYEIILVDDNCPELSWEIILELTARFPKLHGIKLSRNFGQHNAIAAGLAAARGNWIVVMDCDLQDIPEEIPSLYSKAMEGYEIVLARRAERNDNLMKRITSRFFYTIFSYLTDTKQDPSVANFGIYKKNVVDAVLSMGDYVRVFPILVQWVGFKRTAIDVEHGARFTGRSSYTVGKLFRLAFSMIISFSEKPLLLGLRLGLVIVILAFLFGLVTFIMYISGKILVPGYASLILSIWLFSGLIISFIGLTGLYVGKIFEKVKARPNYIIYEKTQGVA
jgi:dolichol-phosphate mannosyltransferase